jgi:hypothetical protein
MIVVLGSGFAMAQTMPQQPSQAPSSPNAPSAQSPSTDQQPSSTAPDQSKPLPNTDQNSGSQTSQPSSNDQSSQPSTTGQSGQTDKDKSGQSLPQSDAAPSASGNANATGDVQTTIQSALQKDPTLSTANVTVEVKNGKMVTLNGTVPSKDAKDIAERIAKENANGMKVKNHLKVASNDMNKPKSDTDKPMSNPK